MNYQKRDLYYDTISRAKSIIEAYQAGKLFSEKGSAHGVIFSLKNNFRDWHDKQIIDITARQGAPSHDEQEKLAEYLLEQEEQKDQEPGD